MPYIGRNEGVGFSGSTKDRFSGDNSTTGFTLSRSAPTANDLQIFVDNVRQEPTIAYSVSGATLTFTEAPPTGTNNVYVVHTSEIAASVLPPQDLGTTDYIFGDDISLQSDSAVINFGTDSDVTLTHNHNTGLDLNLAMTATTFEPDGDTAAGDNAAIGYTSAEGLILTGQGSTNDVTIKNDADADVISIPTGTTNVAVVGDLTVDTSTLKVDSSNNRVGMGTASPSRQVMISRTIADGSGELGIVSSDSSTTGALGNIHFGNSTDSSLASIRATADGATDSAKLEFNTEKTGAAIETAMKIDSVGRVTKPLQPAFGVTSSGNQLNMTTDSLVTIVCDSERFDVGSHFASNTFTAPVTGKYFLSMLFNLRTLDSAADYYLGRLSTSNKSYDCHIDADFGQDNSFFNLNMGICADMDANDTALLQFYQAGGSAQTDINAGEVFFSGYLVA